jgi:hypothetical protein
MIKPKGFSLPPMKRHTPKTYQGTLAKSTSSPDEIVAQTPTLQKLYAFLDRPLPDGRAPEFHPRSK